ncbi:MAG: helix-turn-helix domain-containing protein [Armatimonadota bacterium]
MACDDNILTIAEVADYLRLNPQTVYRLAQQGQLPGFKVGRHWRFSRRHIEEWIKAQVRRPREESVET